MTFFISEHDEDVYVMIEYYTGILREETVKRMARHLENVIKAVIKDPCPPLKDIDIISQEEKKLVLYDFKEGKPGGLVSFFYCHECH